MEKSLISASVSAVDSSVKYTLKGKPILTTAPSYISATLYFLALNASDAIKVGFIKRIRPRVTSI